MKALFDPFKPYSKYEGPYITPSQAAQGPRDRKSPAKSQEAGELSSPGPRPLQGRQKAICIYIYREIYIYRGRERERKAGLRNLSVYLRICRRTCCQHQPSGFGAAGIAVQGLGFRVQGSGRHAMLLQCPRCSCEAKLDRIREQAQLSPHTALNPKLHEALLQLYYFGAPYIGALIPILSWGSLLQLQYHGGP